MTPQDRVLPPMEDTYAMPAIVVPSATPGGAQRGPLSLVDQLTQDAVASDYAHIEPERRSGRSLAIHAVRAGLVLGAVGVFLGIAVTQATSSKGSLEEQRTGLVAQIRAAEAQAEAYQSQVSEIEAKIDAAQKAAVGGGTALLSRQVETLELMTGFSAVQGDGFTVTLSDGTEPSKKTGQVEQVYDTDLQMVVNALWEKGASAIDVNGQRISPRTAIRSAGSAITVNYRPLRPPYTVSAIGDPDSLQKGFEDSAARTTLDDLNREYGISYEAAQKDGIRMAAAGTRFPDRATIYTGPVESPVSTPSATTSGARK